MAIEITTERETTLEDSNEDRDPLEMKDLGKTRFNCHLKYQKMLKTNRINIFENMYIVFDSRYEYT